MTACSFGTIFSRRTIPASDATFAPKGFVSPKASDDIARSASARQSSGGLGPVTANTSCWVSSREL